MILKSVVAVAAMLGGVLSPAMAVVFNVDGAGALTTALAAASGGDVISLAGGDYGALKLLKRHYSSPVTIRSANAADPAKFGTTQIALSSNISFDSVLFERPLPNGMPDYTQAVLVRDSAAISFTGVEFRGSPNGDASDDGGGLRFTNSSGISVEDSYFNNLVVGLGVDRSADVLVKGNRFATIRRDGLNFAQVQGAVIEENRFSDFRPVNGEHADAIQFWTAQTTVATSDIRIADNLIVGDAQGQMQGIFLGSEAGYALPYDDIDIRDNVLASTSWNGIYVKLGTDISVGDNSIHTLPGQTSRVSWIILREVMSGEVAGNSAAAYVYQNVASDVDRFDNAINSPNEAIRLASIAAWDDAHSADTVGIGGVAAAAAVPEPGTWATMLSGFAMVGFTLRKRRSPARPALRPKIRSAAT